MRRIKFLWMWVAVLSLVLFSCEEPTKPTLPQGGTGGGDDEDPNPPIVVCEYGPQHDTVFEAGGIRFYMKYVPAGSFYMGASNSSNSQHYDVDADNSVESPVHHVTLSGYLMSETEVSQALFLAVMGYNPAPDDNLWLPVRGVSYSMAFEFLNRLSQATGYRFHLPTEAQWEYAARGANADSVQEFVFSGSANVEEVAWYEENADGAPHWPASKKANNLGIYDLTGNVAEWCFDWYGPYNSYSEVDPEGCDQPFLPTDRRMVVRGGSYASSRYYLRNTWRESEFPAYEGYDVGLRLVMRCR